VTFEWNDNQKLELEISEQQYHLGWDEVRRQVKPSHVPDNASMHISHFKIWNTEDGTNKHPGDMYYAPWMHEGGCPYWDNCNDPRGHLIVVLPTGFPFDTDGKASNCNKKDDRTHRCWEKHGEAPNISLGGPTSDNGVGSIGAPGYHGYLRNGELVQ
jgi:hypothetical protein